MKIGVSIKLDVTKIDKNRLFKGQKGTYLDATIFIDVDQKDQYENNGMITQDVTKEEKNQNVRGAILGNVKVFWNDSQQQAPQQQQQSQQQQTQQQSAYPVSTNQQQDNQSDFNNEFDSDLPF